MTEHPIEGLMHTAMNSIKDMIDVNTIIGDPIQASNSIVVIPISKVSFGFAAGGSEIKVEKSEERFPFGGGTGAGISLNPVAFLVIQENMVKLLPIDHSTSIDKLLDYIPDLFEKVSCMLNKSMQNKKEQTDKIIDSFNRDNSKKDENKDEVLSVAETEIELEEDDDE